MEQRGMSREECEAREIPGIKSNTSILPKVPLAPNNAVQVTLQYAYKNVLGSVVGAEGRIKYHEEQLHKEKKELLILLASQTELEAAADKLAIVLDSK